MKRILFLILTLAILIGLFSFSASAALPSGTCGNNVTWNIDYYGRLNISGRGAMYDYSEDNLPPWFSYNTDIIGVFIEGGVTSVGDWAFANLVSLVTINMYNSDVQTIGEYAFFSCPELRTLGLPDSLKWIDTYAFSLCTNLKVVEFPSKLEFIGENAFTLCPLWDIVIPNSVESLGSGAFSYCKNLETATLGSGLKSISSTVFAYCENLNTLTLHNTITSIGSNAFKDCSSLDNVYFYGTSAQWSSIYSTNNTALRSAYKHFLSVTYTPLGNFNHRATYWCSSCNQAEGSTDDTQISCTDGNQNGYCDLCNYRTTDSGSCGDNVQYLLTIEGVLRFTGTGAMDDYWDNYVPWQARDITIHTVYIDAGITSLGDYVLSKSYENVSCEVVLKNVYYLGTKTQWKTIDKGKYNEALNDAVIHYMPMTNTSLGNLTHEHGYVCVDCGKGVDVQTQDCTDENSDLMCDMCGQDYREAILGQGSCGPSTYWVVNGLRELTVSGTGSIFNVPPWNKDIVRATIEEGITSIRNIAFKDCTELASVSLPSTVKEIGYEAFAGCTALTSIDLPDALETIEHDAFANCTALTSITLPEGLWILEKNVFSGCTSLTSVSLPSTLYSINDSMFRGCTALTSIDLPYISKLGASVFSGCTALTSVTFTSRLDTISEYAFSGCTALTSIALPDSVTSLGHSAFYGCTALTTVTLPEGLDQIQYDTFAYCSSLKQIDLRNVKNIGGSAFNKSGLTSIVIPSTVTYIGLQAFSNCRSLKSFELCGAIPEAPSDGYYWSYYLFDNSPNVIVYRRPGPLYNYNTGTIQEQHDSRWHNKPFRVKTEIMNNRFTVVSPVSQTYNTVYAAVYVDGKMIDLAKAEAVVDRCSTTSGTSAEQTYYVCDFENKIPDGAIVKFFHMGEQFAPVCGSAIYN